MASEKYVVIPDTQLKVYDGSVVTLFRLPNLKWIIHYGVYSYNGRNKKGWYFSSIPSDTVMPVYTEDLIRLRVWDSPVPVPPPGPHPPHPPLPPGPGPVPPGPHPPAPIPIPYTPQDKMQVEHAMITVDDLSERDRMSSDTLPNGKIIRVNDTDGEGTIEYYSWNSARSEWEPASLGYRYMTRDEVEQAIGDSIIDIVWSNENGALVVTNPSGSTSKSVQLEGLAHDPTYTPSELTIRIPIYGKEDFIVKIPDDKSLKDIAFNEAYHFTDPERVAPAIVATVSDGTVTEEIAGDASGIRNLFNGEDTATVEMIISNSDGQVKANVKLSSIADNPLKIDNEGFWVDLSGVIAKQNMEASLLLVSDGNGQFTYGGNGVGLEQTTAIADLADPEKKVVTANLIADAIQAAVTALQMIIDGQIADINNRIIHVEDVLNFGRGEDGEILFTSGDGVRRSGYKLGGNVLNTESEDTVATEKAVADALKWVTV